MNDSNRRIWLPFLALLYLAFSEGRAVHADPRQDYRELARNLSHDYLLDRAEVAEEPHLPSLERLSKAGDTGVQGGAAQLLKGIEVFEEKKRIAEQEAKDRIARAEATLEKARRGELRRTVTYVDSDGRTREYEVDDSFGAVMFAYGTLGGSGPKNPKVEAFKRRIALDSSRSSGWDELLPAGPEKFAGPLSRQPLVKIEFLGDGPDGHKLTERTLRFEDLLPCRCPFRGRYVARNLAGRDLHNVTLAVDMFHFSTLPDATLRHVYFVPEWKKGATLEFSRTFAANPRRGGKIYRVPVEPEDSGAFAFSELRMMAGVVRMQATVWSDEARQSATTVELPERAKVVAARLVELAELRIASDNYDWFTKRIHQIQLDELLLPVLAFLPADDPAAKRAKRLLEDFESIRPELLKKADEALVAACAEGRRYEGHWSKGSVGGELSLLFISCDATGKRIRAELFDPKNPEQRRLVAGFVGRDAFTREKTILLEPLFPDKGFDHEILSSWVHSYRFKLNEEQLSGEASRSDLAQPGYDGDQKRILLKPASGDAKELAEAKRRDQAARSAQPREPFVERVEPRLSREEANRRAEELTSAMLLANVGKYAEARKAFEKIIKSYPDTRLADSAKLQLDQLKDRPATPSPRSTSVGKPADPPAATAPPPATPGRNPLTGGLPLGGPNPTASPGGEVDPKKMTLAERRAKAQADARNEKLALQSLTLGKQAIAKKNPDLAKLHLRQAMSLAPHSRAAKQAEKLLEDLEER